MLTGYASGVYRDEDEEVLRRDEMTQVLLLDSAGIEDECMDLKCVCSTGCSC